MRLIFTLLVGGVSALYAERLPIRTFTTADGLGHNAVNRIVQDSRGWIWFATSEGLTRYDGLQFKTYGTSQGLSDRLVNDLLVTSQGEYWVATGYGACRFNPRGGAKLFACLTSKAAGTNYINALLEEKPGVILCATEGGLLRLVRDGGGTWHTDRPAALAAASDSRIAALLRDHRNRIWAGGAGGLFRLGGDDTAERPAGLGEARTDTILSLTEDRDGGMWAGADGALYRIVQEPQPVVEQRYPASYIQALRCSSDGRLLVGTTNGLSILSGPLNRAGRHFQNFGIANGLPTGALQDLLEDREGNIWLATDGGGASRISRSRISTFDERDGLSGDPVISIFEDRKATLCVLSRGDRGLSLSRFEGGRFVTTRLNLGPEIRKFGWGSSQAIAQDAGGAWWIATGEGLAAYRNGDAHQLGETAPVKIYGAGGGDGLPGGNIFRVYGDSRGGVWVSTSHQAGNGLAHRDPGEHRFQAYSEKEGLGDLRMSPMAAFAEDGSGHLWMGSLLSGLYRYDGARFRLFTAAEGAPEGGIRAILRSRNGTLWLGSSRSGLVRVSDAESERPHFTSISTANGLASDLVNTLCEDRWGRIYVGSSRGVDRIDAEAHLGKLRHFAAADGLPPNEIEVGHSSRDGDLWFGTQRGLVRLVPEPEAAEPAPSGTVWILALRAGGVEVPVSELGDRTAGDIELASDRNQLRVEYGTIGSGGTALYQYRLGGADTGWSEPTSHGQVDFAGLTPGSYHLEIRAAGSDEAPAAVDFRVIPPIWGRWWMRLLALTALAGAVYAAYRYRVARLLEMERIRTRIATDLHDDIGSSLSQISILGEVARRKLEGDRSGAQELVEQIAAVSRELVDSMSDIVWAINPNRDRLLDLAQRMRRFSGDVFTAKSIDFNFDAPDAGQDRALGASVRREVFLVFKEAVHNAIRHSGCTRADISLHFEAGWLVLRVIDNGHGFAPDQGRGGHGLSSMSERAQRLNGSFEVDSGAGGTSIILRVALPGQVGGWWSGSR